jgi:DNA-binding response OmpR family regulator
MGARILVVDDDPLLAAALRRPLAYEGFDVEVASSGEEALTSVREHTFDLVILDILLPGIDGLEVCRRIQRDRELPVLMLTARDSESDLVLGLTVGADDYLTKPFGSRELVARVHALFRRVDRARANAATHPPAGAAPVRVGEIEIDPARRIATRAGEVVHLTPIEFDLLAFLAARPGTVRTREELLAEVWGEPMVSGGRTVDSHVRALRRKLGADLVRTVHGVGYAIDAPAGTEVGP